MHQTVRDILIRVTLHTNPSTNMNDVNQCMDNALSTRMHAMRCSVSAAHSDCKPDNYQKQKVEPNQKEPNQTEQQINSTPL